MKHRIHYLDVAKGIGIILVVFGHIIRVPEARAWIWNFHMPLFFFVSGLLFSANEQFMTFLKKKLKALVIPFVIFFTITFLYWLIIERRFRGGEYSVEHQLLGIVYGTHESSHLNFNCALWFLPCLFSVEIIEYFIVKLKSCLARGTCLLMCFAIGQILLRRDIQLPWGVHTAMFAICFLGLGYELKGRLLKSEGQEVPTKILLPAAMILCFVFTLNTKEFNSSLGVANIPYMLMAMIGIAMILCISRLLSKKGGVV